MQRHLGTSRAASSLHVASSKPKRPCPASVGPMNRLLFDVRVSAAVNNDSSSFSDPPASSYPLSAPTAPSTPSIGPVPTAPLISSGPPGGYGPLLSSPENWVILKVDLSGKAARKHLQDPSGRALVWTETGARNSGSARTHHVLYRICSNADVAFFATDKSIGKLGDRLQLIDSRGVPVLRPAKGSAIKSQQSPDDAADPRRPTELEVVSRTVKSVQDVGRPVKVTKSTTERGFSVGIPAPVLSELLETLSSAGGSAARAGPPFLVYSCVAPEQPLGVLLAELHVENGVGWLRYPMQDYVRAAKGSVPPGALPGAKLAVQMSVSVIGLPGVDSGPTAGIITAQLLWADSGATGHLPAVSVPEDSPTSGPQHLTGIAAAQAASAATESPAEPRTGRGRRQQKQQQQREPVMSASLSASTAAVSSDTTAPRYHDQSPPPQQQQPQQPQQQQQEQAQQQQQVLVELPERLEGTVRALD